MYIIGLMSGTSLDGLDIALCRFDDTPSDALDWQLLAARTYPYPDDWVACLSGLDAASAYDYALAHVRLGRYFGELVNRFRTIHPYPVDAIASHGHTVFHQPRIGLTAQIADGDAIAAVTGLPVVYNFRTLDVALGGQGAPLVPVGDRLLFPQYDACLNLGGFSNISYDDAGGLRRAFDIAPCNMALNSLSRRLGHAFDRDGAIARGGAVNPALLDALDSLEYYAAPSPKSLGKEWYLSAFYPLIQRSPLPVPVLLRTVVEHIARQIAAALRQCGCSTLLVTGGGAHNTFLVERIAALASGCRVNVPEPDIVDYKEAVIFALLGYLRLQRRPNILASVTGASADACGGCLAGLLN